LQTWLQGHFSSLDRVLVCKGSGRGFDTQFSLN